MPWYTENLPRKKSTTQKVKIFIGFSVIESAGRLTPFKLETPESLEKNGFLASSDLYRFPNGGDIVYDRIRGLREDRDLFQKDIAEYLNCTQVCYSRYELGMRDIPTDVLIKLAEYYGTSTDYLLGRTDEINPYPRKK